MADSQSVLSAVMAQRDSEWNDLRRVDRYMRGQHAPSYMPKKSQREYAELVQRAVTNWLPLVVGTVGQRLYVEGYRDAEGQESSPAWPHWSRNDMASRQSLAHRASLTYGVSYVAVEPGDAGPSIRPYSPLVMTGVAEEPDAEWLSGAGRYLRADSHNGILGKVWRVYDETAIRDVWVADAGDDGGEDSAPEIAELSTVTHNLGVVPVVPFRNQWADSPFASVVEQGEVWPLISTQDALNDTKVSLAVAQTAAAHRQKWAAGMTLPEDIDGNPINPFKSHPGELWVAADESVRFGEFGATDLTGYLKSVEMHIQHLSAVSQVPPAMLLGGMVNISAEALAASENGLRARVAERQALFGEAWGKVLRLAAGLSGDKVSAEATDAVILWRDTEARSLAQTVDALGKGVTMLGIPQRAAWEMWPGATAADVERWVRMRDEQAALDTVADLMFQGPGPAAAPVMSEGAPVGDH
ncbi:phage portal protein [Kitasatospora sp. NPDC003701]